MLRKIIRSYFVHPLIRDLAIDSPASTIAHYKIIREKPGLRSLYREWYLSIKTLLRNSKGGPVLELGSGGGSLKEVCPDLITSDLFQSPFVDMVLDGLHLPFRDGSLYGIVMIDVFHHLPDLRRFLSEALRSLKPGGIIVMIEPWATTWSRLFYKYFHHEPFLTDLGHWGSVGPGRLSGANGALPWIVFHRDRKRLEEEFPQLKVREITLHCPFCYVLSGGVSFRNFVPLPLFRMARKMEEQMEPLMKYLAMFASIVLQRKDD